MTQADLMRSGGLRSWGSRRGNNERGSNGQNAPLVARLGIPPLDDDGRSHPCGGRVYRSCISSKQERTGQRIEPGTGIHPNRTAKGYARICVGGWRSEGEGEIERRWLPVLCKCGMPTAASVSSRMTPAIRIYLCTS